MRIAILCPGPSLANLSGPPSADLLIAVNRAATAFPADVWACGDPKLLERERAQVRGLPELFTTAATAWQIEDAETPWPRNVTLFDSLCRFCPVPQWQTFTFTAALVYAAHRIEESGLEEPDGISHIRIFGCDWQGESDFDGQTGPDIAGNRRPERWQLERNITENLLVPWLTEQGVEVKRIVADAITGGAKRV